MGLVNTIQHAVSQLGLAVALGAEPAQEPLSRLSMPQPLAIPVPLDPVRQLTGSHFFKSASPRQQCSLLNNLHSAFVRAPSQGLDVAGALLDQLSSICDAPAYERLSDRQRLAVLSIAHLEIPNFERIFYWSAPQPPIARLSRSGDEVLVRLESLSRQPSNRLGASGSSVVRQLLSSVLNPDGIRQLGPTCYPTVLVRQLALTEPEEFIRLTADLVENGATASKFGLSLTFNEAWRDSSASKSFGFPVAQVLPWALYQAMSTSPLNNIEQSLGLGELSTGIDAALFLGRNVHLRIHDGQARARFAAGDILFLTPDENRRGHVLQVAGVGDGMVTLYDPNGTRGMKALVEERVRAAPGEVVEPSERLVRITPSLLGRVVATSFRLTPTSGGLPQFAVEWPNGELTEFPTRESLQAFITEEQGRHVLAQRDGSMRWGAVLIGMTALFAYGVFRAARGWTATPTQKSFLG